MAYLDCFYTVSQFQKRILYIFCGWKKKIDLEFDFFHDWHGTWIFNMINCHLPAVKKYSSYYMHALDKKDIYKIAIELMQPQRKINTTGKLQWFSWGNFQSPFGVSDLILQRHLLSPQISRAQYNFCNELLFIPKCLYLVNVSTKGDVSIASMKMGFAHRFYGLQLFHWSFPIHGDTVTFDRFDAEITLVFLLCRLFTPRRKNVCYIFLYCLN